ncbi:MAG: dihydrodipicolinate synthase family protein [Rikenellaceae bacterium]|nr:dihydrodipicolinate synthase family protein [Rikenellaceae bacterium]
MKRIEGLITAPFTPFGASGGVESETVDRLQEFYKYNGIRGVFICGTTGESSALTFSEKAALFERWGRHRSDDFMVIGFLGGTSVGECRKLAAEAGNCGLDAIAVTAPYYFKPTGVEELAQFCAEVADASPLPFYYYHIPSFTGVYFNMYELLGLVDGRVPTFAGIKYTYEDMMDYQRCLGFGGGRYDILWGRDEMLLSALVVGARSAVGSTYGYTAPLYLRIMEAYAAGDIATARSLQLKATDYIALLQKYGPSAGKAFMRAVGMDCGRYRLPVRNLDPAGEAAFLRDLAATDFHKYCSRTVPGGIAAAAGTDIEQPRTFNTAQSQV